MWGPFFSPYINKSLFLIIMERVYTCDSYYVPKLDALENLWLSSCQKIMAALRMFALGIYTGFMDEYCRAIESTVTECMKQFYVAIQCLSS